MLKEPPLKTYTIHGSAVRDIPILPDCISPDPEGWLCECWCRMDPRIQYRRDIEPRIRPDLRPKHVTRFATSRLRFRRECHLLGWLIKRTNFVRERTEILEAATEAGIDVEATNSTRGLSWGLVDPAQGEAGGRISVPKSLRPKNTREGQCARDLLSTSGSNGVLAAASIPCDLRQTSSLGAQIDSSRDESPSPEQAVSFSLHNDGSATRSNSHDHDEADPVHIPRGQGSSQQAILPGSLSSSEQSVLPVARPCLAKQSEMLPAQFSPAQVQSSQLKNSQRYDAMCQVWNTIATGLLKHESSWQYPARAGLDEQTLEVETQVLNTAVDVRHQQLHSLYFSDSARIELVEPLSEKSPHRSSQSKKSNMWGGDAQAHLEFIRDTNSTTYVPMAYETSHFKAPDVYQGYARSTEQFFQNESGTYVPLLLKDIPPRTSKRDPSVSASVYNGMIQARAHQAQERVDNMEQHYLPHQLNMYPIHQIEDGARLSQDIGITPLQHAEHNSTSMRKPSSSTKWQVGNDATKSNFEVPSLGNKLVEALHQHNDIQLLDQLWIRTGEHQTSP